MALPTRSPLVRFYLWQGRRWKRLVAALDGAWAGLWLGLLSRRHLDAADELHYRTSNTYAGEDHNRRGLMEWEEAALDPWFNGRTRLAVLGAGGGREVLALERRGHRVDGFECNPGLVEFARTFLLKEGAHGSVRLLPRDTAPEGCDYDGLIIGWGAYMLTPGRARRIALLRQLRPLVGAGAPLLLSFFTQPPIMTKLKVVCWVASPIRRLLGRERPELGDDLMPLYVHRFNEAQIESELAEAGFRLLRYEPEGRRQHDCGWAVAEAQPGGTG